jgi:hypothetical protein
MLDRPQRVTATNEAPQRAAPASAIEIFRERCEARAHLVAYGLHSLQDSVDTLQEAAAAQGLVTKYGQDAIQQIMAESFGRWRLANE